MRNKFRYFATLLVATAPFIARAADEQNLCARYHFTRPIQPPLTHAETILICGSPASQKGALAGSRAWSNVPASQAILSLAAFLQSRGYLKPKVTPTGEIFEIDPGPLTKVERVTVQGAPPGIDLEFLQKHRGEKLTPTLLTEVEKAATQALIHHGYPCPQAHAEGDPEGSVLLRIESGRPRRIHDVKTGSVPGTVDGILSRYDAFHLNDVYDSEVLAISSDRAISSGMVEDTYFIADCRGTEEVDLRQVVRPGEPRIVSLGAWINTEEVVNVNIAFRDTRIGEAASQAEVRASASWKIQELTAFYQDYFLSEPSRQWIRPLLRGLHQNENPFEILRTDVDLGYGTSWDTAGAGGQIAAGPEFSFDNVLRGAGPAYSHALRLFADFRLMSHELEFNRDVIRGGSQLLARGDLSSSSVGSSYSARILQLIGEQAWALGSKQAHAGAFLLLHLREGFRTTGFDGDTPALLPPEDREYLGGQADVRGFGRMEIPGTDLGGLSSWFGNLELRVNPWDEKLEPMVFLDAGGFGNSSFTIQSPLYWSPGIGVTWLSPIGTLQSTFAHGYVTSGERDPFSHWQFYLRLGGSL